MFPLFRVKFDIQAFDKSSFVQSFIRSVSQPSKHRCQWALPSRSGRPQDTHSLFLRPDQRPMSFEHLLATFNANLQVATFGNIYIFRLLGLSKWHQIEDVISWESWWFQSRFFFLIPACLGTAGGGHNCSMPRSHHHPQAKVRAAREQNCRV